MYICDSHIHSKYSIDGDKSPAGSLESICKAAIEAGLSEITVTDHFDVNSAYDGIYGYDADSAYEEYLSVKDKYEGKIRFNFGIELGQPCEHPELAEKMLASKPFDFVLGSLHCLKGVPDFFFLKYEAMLEAEYILLWKRYLTELHDLVDSGYINSLAHITYPYRYIKRAGRELDLTRWYDDIERIFEKIIKKGIALEINTSGYRQGMEGPVPDDGIIRLYQQCGGKLITCGSDAHRCINLGSHIEDEYIKLKGIGFENINVFRNGKAIDIKI